MRILQVVTLLTPEGAFGGPVRVASHQTNALRAAGHEVVVVAGTLGYGGKSQPPPPDTLDGVPLRHFPVRHVVPGAGFSGLASPAMLRWARRVIPTVDIVHIHLARDMITLPIASAALRLGAPYVLQPHGMVVESGHPFAKPLDTLMTRRVLTGASTVLYLTDAERTGLQRVARGRLTLELLGNGVPAVEDIPPLPERPQVLFCARLQERKRPRMFVEMARQLLAEGVDADFALVGPDEGQGARVAADIAAAGVPADRLRWEGPLDPAAVLKRMAQASLVVLPSVDEPYPMSILEALSMGRPAVITESCGLAPQIRDSACGLVVDETLEGLVTGVRSLLSDDGELLAMSGRAVETARSTFAMDAVMRRLTAIYERSVRPGKA